jgi:thiol-disulfide isomerase/thioredoxin
MTVTKLDPSSRSAWILVLLFLMIAVTTDLYGQTNESDQRTNDTKSTHASASKTKAPKGRWLGVVLDRKELANGVRISGIFDNSPASVCGLQKGDVIVAVGANLVRDTSTLRDLLRDASGSPAQIKLRRGSKTFTASCSLSMSPPASELVKRHLVGKPAPRINLYEVADSRFEGAIVFEPKPTLLFFWATWCTACKPVFPKLREINVRWREQIVLLGVSYESADRLQSHQESYSPPFRSLRDPDQSAHDEYLVTAIPTVVLIDRDGRVAGISQNSKELALLIRKVANLIKTDNSGN